MIVTRHPSLKDFNSFGVEATAGLMLTLENEEDLLAMPAFDPTSDFLLGGGSNVLFASDVPGTVFRNGILGKAIVCSDDDHSWVEAAAGETWHELVRWTLQEGLCGLENLSLIPGLAGAAPIQNIGAYGVELSQVLESVTAWDLARASWKTFSLDECQPGYRDSYFKSIAPDRYLITSIRLRLNRVFIPRLDYKGLREELESVHSGELTALQISDAVMRIRQRKLQDPATIGNAGSFFKNPVVPKASYQVLAERFTELPNWHVTHDTIKLSAAWMIEHCGLKAYREGDAGVSEQHALVLVNHGNASGRQILNLARTIQSRVQETFDILLEPEPRVVDYSALQRS
jgi:UDP-N-acetylmuramate dehydrogenase